MEQVPIRAPDVQRLVEERIYEKWTKIGERIMDHLNLPTPLEPFDGMILLFRVATDSIRVAIAKMGPIAVSAEVEQFAQAETIAAAFFDSEMSKVYARTGTEPIDVSGMAAEVEGNPTYKVLGFEVAASEIIMSILFQYLAMNEQIPSERRIPNDRVALGLDLKHLPPHLYPRAVEIEKALNAPPIGITDRIGGCLIVATDSIGSLADQLNPVNQKTVAGMRGPAAQFFQSAFGALTATRKDPASVLGFMAGIMKVAGDVAQQTMAVITQQQAVVRG